MLYLGLLPYQRMRYMYVPSYVYHATSWFFKLFNNPVDSVSQWFNTNRKIWKILYLSTLEISKEMRVGFHVKCLLLLYAFDENYNVSTIYSKGPLY
jgi:hypothetical protein